MDNLTKKVSGLDSGYNNLQNTVGFCCAFSILLKYIYAHFWGVCYIQRLPWENLPPSDVLVISLSAQPSRNTYLSTPVTILKEYFPIPRVAMEKFH